MSRGRAKVLRKSASCRQDSEEAGAEAEGLRYSITGEVRGQRDNGKEWEIMQILISGCPGWPKFTPKSLKLLIAFPFTLKEVPIWTINFYKVIEFYSE